MKIDCILPERSQYHVLHHFTMKVAEALKRYKHSVRIISAESCRELCTQSPPELTLSFNGAPQFSEGIFLCDVLDVPHASLLVDPPYYYLGLLESPLIKIYCDDATNIPILESLGYPNAAFLTQGVEPELTFDPKEPREYDLVFFGSFFDVVKARDAWKENFSPELCKVMDEAIQETISNDSLNLSHAFEIALKGKIDLLNGVSLPQLFYAMSYVQKGEARMKLLESFRNLPIHIWDTRWKTYFKESKFIIHDAIDYSSMLEILKKSKIVLCNSIRSVMGCNERVLNALACGAVPVTNANPYFRKHFEDNKHLLMYEKLGNLEERIIPLLNNPEKREEIAFAGKHEVSKNHTWDSRLNDVGFFSVNS